MPISIQQLEHSTEIDTVVIHSLSPMLYQATALVAGEELLVTDEQGKALKAFHLMEIQSRFKSVPLKHLWLRHRSAYDEMIGQAVRSSSNQLQIELALPNEKRPAKTISAIGQESMH